MTDSTIFTVLGGMGSVSESIATSARSYGAEIVTNASVKRILTKSKNKIIIFFYVVLCCLMFLFFDKMKFVNLSKILNSICLSDFICLFQRKLFFFTNFSVLTCSSFYYNFYFVVKIEALADH